MPWPVPRLATLKRISINEQSTLVFANKRTAFPLCGKLPWIKLHGWGSSVRAPAETNVHAKDFYGRPNGIKYLMKWPDHSSSSGSSHVLFVREFRLTFPIFLYSFRIPNNSKYEYDWRHVSYVLLNEPNKTNKSLPKKQTPARWAFILPQIIIIIGWNKYCGRFTFT